MKYRSGFTFQTFHPKVSLAQVKSVAVVISFVTLFRELLRDWFSRQKLWIIRSSIRWLLECWIVKGEWGTFREKCLWKGMVQTFQSNTWLIMRPVTLKCLTQLAKFPKRKSLVNGLLARHNRAKDLWCTWNRVPKHLKVSCQSFKKPNAIVEFGAQHKIIGEKSEMSEFEIEIALTSFCCDGFDSLKWHK